ncbi:unnamed protein product [Prunus armeniaca]|uniref:Uncharacterized protein n=1 Tax=Prunus armeniaca TaxID=36596 RepID=A0A6J5UAL6_PRUAR|nr:unnamed protein product [Prunus armeniaca]CAB4303962.1 unnamed protein product [Prunus armeniaca]
MGIRCSCFCGSKARTGSSLKAYAANCLMPIDGNWTSSTQILTVSRRSSGEMLSMILVEKFSLYKNPDRAHILSLTNFGSPMLAFQMVVHCHHFSTSNKK